MMNNKEAYYVIDTKNTEIKITYEDKEYIMYTQNKEVDEDNIKVFISILHKENDQYQLLGITDDQEWETVQKAINEMDEDENE